MDKNGQDPPPRHRLPAADGDEHPQPGRVVPGRDLGLRRVRRLSNWTAASLVAAAAVTAGYFARGSVSTVPVTAKPTGTAAAAPAGTRQPCISTPVAVSGGSGVTARAPVRVCGSGTSAPVVIYAGPAAGHGDS